MAILLLLLDHPGAVDIGPEAAAHLTALGVTRVSLAQGVDAAALVLEGWSFDPRRCASEAAEAVGAPGARALHAVLELSVP